MTAYDAIVGDYHWLHDDVGLRLGTTTPGVRAALRALGEGDAVLDAACGIGLDAVALARRGMDVTAADANEAMVEATRAGLAAAGLDAAVVHAPWAELPRRVGEDRFDAVLCTGNSLAHADAAGVRGALAAFWRVLRPGGLLVVDTHRWESVLAAGDHAVAERGCLRRAGATASVRYRWRVEGPAEGARRCRLSVEMEIAEAGGVRTASHDLDFHPFSVEQLLGWVRERFEVVTCDAHPAEDRYSVVARRPGAQGEEGRR
jgi:SAM-dependent methyltransferase